MGDFGKYVAKRIEIFDRLYAAEQERTKALTRVDISVSTPYGTYRGLSYETTPFHASKELNPEHSALLVCKVNGKLFDVHRALRESCRVEFLGFESPEGKQVFWHSSAHILGEACEKHYECNLCLGPPTESGFFYEMEMDKTVTPEDYPALARAMRQAVKENQQFQRLEMKKADLLEMFADNPLKVELIQSKVESCSTVYRCGPLIDFCLGPHIPSTGHVKAAEITSHGSSFFLGDSSRPVLQRIYGISFPSKTLMSEHLIKVAEAKKYNHRKLGTELELFFFSPASPGSCFFLPKGAFVYNALVQLIRENYRARGFKEVITPNVFTNELWKKSGHWDNYKDEMFCFEAEGEMMALKPMNCPGHCLMFKSVDRSYRELPLRLADFGVLHRNEVSGALTGLTRVRRFQQDDAHIFVQKSQVGDEISKCLGFLGDVYRLLGFEFNVLLSTRPANYIGEVGDWDQAEAQLKEALDASGIGWELSEGDGAFYGPKIDVSLKDAMGRKHQCGTIQLDFQLPARFDLKFRTDEGLYERPVMVHRAILGSVERMIGIVLEHFRGRLPPWLNPNQIAIVPVSSGEYAYALQVKEHFKDFEVSVDVSSSSLGKKILNAEKLRASFVVVVGPKDRAAGHVNIRKCDNGENVVCGYRRAGEFFAEVVRSRTSNPQEHAHILKGRGRAVGGICTKGLLSVKINKMLSAIEHSLLQWKSRVLYFAASKFVSSRNAPSGQPTAQ